MSTAPRSKLAFAALAASLGLALSGCSSQAERPGPGVLTERFDVETAALPPGWLPGTSNGAAGGEHARWELERDAAAPSPPGVLALVDARGHSGQEYNLCWSPRPSLGDLEVSVAVRAAGGEEDQGGGPAWRVAGAGDYYLARWNPLEDNFRLYSVASGERRQLAGASVTAAPDAWHTVRVRHVGDEITCWLDGEVLLHARDSAHLAAGGVGVWTKADATTRFDDLVARPAR
jgi:hypothetical protein